MYEILKGGGFTTGGLNFDAKLRRQSIARDDLFHAHIGGMDTMAHALICAADLIESEALSSVVAERYADWSGELGQSILAGNVTLAGLRDRAENTPDTSRASGRQERLENLVARSIDVAR